MRSDPAASQAASRLLAHIARLIALYDATSVAGEALQCLREVTGCDSAMIITAPGAEPATAGPLARALAEDRAEIATRLGDHRSLVLARGAPADAPAAPANVPAAAAGAKVVPAGAQTTLALALRADRPGLLVAASTEAVALDGERVELAERLAAVVAGCLHNAEVIGELRERASRDSLTGLGHYASFHRALAATHRRPRTAVLLCDLDGFKRVNDAHGHAHGDEVLRAIAHAMANALRRGDELFRIGGDEFAALVAVRDEAEAVDAAVRLRRSVAAAGLEVTVSIGVAVPHRDEDDAALVARADRALYAAKGAGRDGVALADGGRSPTQPAPD